MSKERYYLDFHNNYVLSHLAKTVLQYNKYVVKIYQKCTQLFDAYSSNHPLDLVKLNSQSVVSNCMLGSNGSPKESNVLESSEATKHATSTSVKNISNVSPLQRIHSPVDSAGNEELQDVAVVPDKLFSPVKVEKEFDILAKQNLSAICPQKEKPPSSTEMRTPMHANKNTTEAEKFSSKLSQLGHTEMDKTEPVQPEYHCPNRPETVIVSPKKTSKAVSNSKIEVDRKYLNPDTFNFKFLPRLIKTSRGLEIEVYISSQRPKNPIPSTCPESSAKSKITKPATDEVISPKNANSSVYEPKPGCSRDISSSAKSSLTRSQPVAAKAKSPIRADEDIRKDHLSLEETPPTNLSSNLSTPSIEILIDCINQLRDLIAMREGYMQSNYNSLTGFRKCLGYLIIQIENILNVINHIQIVCKYFVNEDFIKNINGLITISVALINNIVSIRLDMKKDIKLWSKCCKEINHIKRKLEILLLDGKPSVNFDVLQKCEDSLKAKWERMDSTIPILESRMSLFLSTAGDFEKCISLFVKCLINVGVLKLSLTPAL